MTISGDAETPLTLSCADLAGMPQTALNDVQLVCRKRPGSRRVHQLVEWQVNS